MTQADRLKKHLHGRGEDLLFGLPSCAVPETPPRTWRRRRACHRHRPGNGNTSTDVEKTRISALAPTEFWKHLHGRGEDANKRKGANIAVETPPRTWRRRRHLVVGKKATGNTSTDVEKTEPFQGPSIAVGKHLHGRGEDRKTSTPFARSRGNTSTDVEKTVLNRDRYRVVQKHLHGRGEDAKNARQAHGQRETPPRTWRRLNIHAQLFCQC